MHDLILYRKSHWSLSSNLRKMFLTKVSLEISYVLGKKKTKMYWRMMLNLGIYLFHVCFKKSLWDRCHPYNRYKCKYNRYKYTNKLRVSFYTMVPCLGSLHTAVGAVYYLCVLHFRKYHWSTDMMYLYIYDKYLIDSTSMYVTTKPALQLQWDRTCLFWTHMEMPTGLLIMIHNLNIKLK